MRRGRTYDWLPLWRRKWLQGSTRWELEPAERLVFIDFLCLAGDDDGHIRANSEMPYSPQYLAHILNVSIEVLTSTVEKCITAGKITRDNNGCLSICNWKAYQLPPRTKRWLMEAPPDDAATDKALDKAIEEAKREDQKLNAKLRGRKS